MGDACHIDAPTAQRDRRVLYVVLAINFAMFALEIWQGLSADSTALIADSMDFLSDAFSYGITLYVLTRPLRVRATASLIKAVLMLLLAGGAFYQGIHNLVNEQVPHFITMGWVGLLALIANVISAMLLYRTRGRDSNMHSVWLCSRNDAIANIAIIVAALFVYLSHSLWPDLIVALIITWLEGSSALKIIAHAKKELKDAH
jgi:cation diffusion facilitator family transporter